MTEQLYCNGKVIFLLYRKGLVTLKCKSYDSYSAKSPSEVITLRRNGMMPLTRPAHNQKPRSHKLRGKSGGYRDSNPGPPEPQSGALTSCAISTILNLRLSPQMSLKGFEPPTHGLEGRCSIQLSYRLIQRVMGIEPTYPAWKAGVLPLNYTRRKTLFYFR